MADKKKDDVKKPDASPAGSSTPISPLPAPQPVTQPAHPVSVPDQDALIEIDDSTWERSVERAGKPVAVMFYSPTCIFCHQIEPYFRNYAQEYRNTVIFVRLNVMTSQWTAERYGVRSTPTFKFFCSGKPVQEMVGAVYPTLLKKMMDEVLTHGKECAKNSTLIDYEITGYG
jgi:thioredoxin-like negative regulator of GroEL